MSMRPDSIRNVSWAVVRDGAEKRHAYRREVDLHLKDGRIVEKTDVYDRLHEQQQLGTVTKA